ncbi:Endocytosis regulator [Elasticomyces elasticus]|nr:Endocytosis regulator [Elasticomyces elasticus]KAK4999915.1 Endocytosis regulator [Elasticomyces elasticus]
MDYNKRASIAGIVGKDRHDSKELKRPSTPKKPSVSLDMVVESPPALMFDAPAQSSGALWSGRLRLHVVEPSVKIKTLTMSFRARTTYNQPVHKGCPDCSVKSNELQAWKFLTEPKTYKQGVHEFPFSQRIPGHLPATTHGTLGTVEYYLECRALTDKEERIDFTRPLRLQRALRPGNDKNSVRIFPPTNLSLNVTLPSVIHPIGEFPVLMRITGVTSKRDETQTRWRLRKLSWRIEENESMVSPACAKHAGKVGGEGKGMQREHSRDLGAEDLKQGWKSDFDDGTIEMEFKAMLNTALKPQCDMESPNGFKVSHSLVLEMVIAEEWAPNRKPKNSTPTGAARVLRTQFNLAVTERTGMGISWDDEMPPMYEDVPPSPPVYHPIKDYHGDDLHEDVEHLQLEKWQRERN